MPMSAPGRLHEDAALGIICGSEAGVLEWLDMRRGLDDRPWCNRATALCTMSSIVSNGADMRGFRTILVVVFAASLMAGSFLAGFGTFWLISGSQAQPSEEEAQGMEVFWESWHILDGEFLGDMPSDLERAYGAAHGMVASFGDPYTVFVEPQPRELERDELRGEFGGIGAWVGQDEDGNLVVTPMKDRPADLAGMAEGDIIVAVDGQDIVDLSRDEVVALIRGPVGTAVSVSVRRASSTDVLVFEIKREIVELPTVDYRMLEDHADAAYVSIRLISERTPGELSEALQDLRQQGAQRLVLDLRHNPGGGLLASVEVASEFLSGGVVLYEERTDGQEKPYRATSNGLALDWPLVVLVDGASASGAEIIAGALQDHGRAPLVGEQTFGKGSVQHVHELSDGSSLHATVARWLTPHRHHLDQQGLTPDEIVELTEEDIASASDPQLERAIALLLEQLS